MRKSRFIATLAALGMATAVYAGNGMGCGACDHQGYGKGMQQHKGNGMMHGKGMKQKNCGGEDSGMKNKGMGMMNGKGMKGHRMANSAEGNMHRGMHGKKMMQERHHHMMKKMMAQLDLSGTQKQKIREIMLEGRQAMKQKHMRPEMDFSQFMSKERFDKEAFKKTMQQKWEANRQGRLAMMSDRIAKIFEILTPEQREKLIELRK